MSQTAQTAPRPPIDTATRDAKRPSVASARRIYAVNQTRSRQTASGDLLSWLKDTGFDTVLLALPRHVGSGDSTPLAPIVDAASRVGLHVHIDLRLDITKDDTGHERGGHERDWYRFARRVADPRENAPPPGVCGLNPLSADAIDAFVEYWTPEIARLSTRGVTGFRCRLHQAVPPEVWRRVILASPGLYFSAWTPGVSAEYCRRLPRDCFQIAFNSLAWWDFGAGWLADEIARLGLIAPVANTVGLTEAPGSPVVPRGARRLLEVAACNGHGLLVPIGFEFGMASDITCPEYGADDWRRLREYAQLDLSVAVRAATERLTARSVGTAGPRFISGEDAPVAVLFHAPVQLTFANRSLGRPAVFDPAAILPVLDGQLAEFTGAGGALSAEPVVLAPGEVRVFRGSPAKPVVTAERGALSNRPIAAAATSRVAIEAVGPAVDAGRFPVKRLAGERVTATADIFTEGHGKLSAALQWRARDASEWREKPMQLEGNDRWSASFLLERVGPYEFRVIAWPDRFATWQDELIKKHVAGLNVALELEEGRLLLEAIAAAAPGTLDALLASLKDRGAPARIGLLTDDATAAQVARADTRPGCTFGAAMRVDADRRAAEFASWYELFPRSQSGDAAIHGTFRDVIPLLPGIRDMGFDVLYFPPIHPIGHTNRKGRDNSMTPAPDDPGSPYAIGSADGGHDAINPDLGTIDDFRALRDAAAAHGMELALDFAIQCSPDHPWLREHPEWFDWRPDGGLRYAENPPKKYEDIVNVDFYRPDAMPSLWMALRDVVAYWADEGVRIFRVDNPHTKPFAFWEWMIADIRSRYPDTLFLAEAFTRPKIMYRLAKLGFSQSYTYFTWRNEKPEIESYLRELTATVETASAASPTDTATNVVDFFRPNFFVNTPDINPIFLQHSGRAGFLIRAALAATLSGLWGMLQGFELCEAAAIPGREEYASSDKYQLRARPRRAPGDIVDEITRLNAIRRANPALQSHRGLAFHQAWNDRVLWFRKANIDRGNVVLVAISLDPFGPQSASVEVPLWEWNLDDDGALIVDDLMHGGSDVWVGKYRTISLDPRTLPFGIWRARPRESV